MAKQAKQTKRSNSLKVDYRWYSDTGHPWFSIAISDQAPLELKKRLIAAYKSYTMGFKSVDYVLKHYGNDWEFATKSPLDKKE